MQHSRVLRKFLIIVVICAIFFGMPRFSSADIQDRIKELREQIEILERQARVYRQNVLEKHGEVNSLSRELSLLKSQIQNLEIKIQLSISRINKTTLEIDELTSNVLEVETKVGAYQKNIGRLIRDLRDAEESNLVTLVLKYTNLSIFFRSVYGVERIQERIIEEIANLKEVKAELETQRARAREKKEELQVLNQQQTAERSSLKSVRTRKDDLLRETKGEENRYQELLNGVEKKKQEFFQEIQVLEAQARQSGDFIVHITADSIPPKGKVFQWPKEKYVLTQSYGYTRYARRGSYGGAPHNGVDFASGCGNKVPSIGTGMVIANGTNDGWGNWIAVRHENKLVSIYAHMQIPAIRAVGDIVQSGTVLGYEGSTGNATGCHVHLSLYHDFFTFKSDKKGGQLYFNYFEGTLNPLNYL